MATNLNDYAEEVTGSAEGQLRLVLLETALARKFSDSEYAQFLGQLALADRDPAFASDIARAGNVTCEQTPDINLDTSSRQLLWAATLLRQAAVGTKDRSNFSDTPFFRHFVSQPIFQQELLRYAQTLSDHFERSRTRIRWGDPLSWFYFSPAENLINLDPFHSLVFGLPRHPQDYAHSRAPAYHEVGHAILSMDLPESFRHTIDRLKELGEKKQPLTDVEQEEVIDKGVEAMLWGQFYNLAEDNVVNRFAVILGRYRHGQNYDYAESLKCVYALINQSRKSFEDFKNDQWSKYVKEGHDFLDKQKTNTAFQQFTAITKILGLSVPVNEGLFANGQAEWERAGLEWAAFMPALDDAGKAKAAAEILAEGDGKPDSISYQQPYVYRVLHNAQRADLMAGIAKASERFFRYLTTDSATIHSPEEIKFANQERNAVIEHLWRKYVVPLLPQIKADMKQQLQQAQQSLRDMADQIPRPPSSGMGTPGQSRQNKPSDQEPQDKPGASDKDDKTDEQKKPGGADDKSSAKDKQQEEAYGSGKDEKKEGKPEPSAGGDNEPKNGGKDKDGGTVESEGNSDPGKLMRDIIGEAENQEAEEGQRQQNQQEKLRAVVRQAQEAKVEIKYDFPEGDWSNYQAAKQQLAWLINIFARQLEDIRKKQVELQIRRGRRMEILPEDGEIDRLDREAHFQLTVRSGAQMPMRAEDYKRFVGNKTAIKLTTPQVVLLIDGSGSMDILRYDTRAAPIDIAISAGLALSEATNQINARVTDPRPAFECYSGIWGPDNPKWLTWPGLEPVEAGKNFDRFRNGLQSNTNLAPAVAMIPKKLSAENSLAKNIGATHLLILSDGDIQDGPKATAQVIKLIENVRNITVDVILISAQENPRIVDVFRHIKGQYPGLNYGVHRIDNLGQLPLTCLKALRQRMIRGVISTPRAAKAAEFKRAALM